MSTCLHEHKEVRRRKDSLGRDQFAAQCIACGARCSNFVPKSKVNFAKVVPWDDELQRKGEEDATAEWESRRLQLESEAGVRNAQWWSNYRMRLSLPDWREKRLAVFERDNYTCKACGKAPAVQVHHLTYEHLGREPLFDLIAVCGPCHDSITYMSRNQKDFKEEIQRQLTALAPSMPKPESGAA